ncbi:MAG: hypothetical protein AB8B67_01980 [Rickettsiaceae bacterium]
MQELIANLINLMHRGDQSKLQRKIRSIKNNQLKELINNEHEEIEIVKIVIENISQKQLECFLGKYNENFFYKIIDIFTIHPELFDCVMQRMSAEQRDQTISNISILRLIVIKDANPELITKLAKYLSTEHFRSIINNDYLFSRDENLRELSCNTEILKLLLENIPEEEVQAMLEEEGLLNKKLLMKLISQNDHESLRLILCACRKLNIDYDTNKIQDALAIHFDFYLSDSIELIKSVLTLKYDDGLPIFDINHKVGHYPIAIRCCMSDADILFFARQGLNTEEFLESELTKISGNAQSTHSTTVDLHYARLIDRITSQEDISFVDADVFLQTLIQEIASYCDTGERQFQLPSGVLLNINDTFMMQLAKCIDKLYQCKFKECPGSSSCRTLETIICKENARTNLDTIKLAETLLKAMELFSNNRTNINDREISFQDVLNKIFGYIKHDFCNVDQSKQEEWLHDNIITILSEILDAFTMYNNGGASFAHGVIVKLLSIIDIMHPEYGSINEEQDDDYSQCMNYLLTAFDNLSEGQKLGLYEYIINNKDEYYKVMQQLNANLFNAMYDDGIPIPQIFQMQNKIIDINLKPHQNISNRFIESSLNQKSSLINRFEEMYESMNHLDEIFNSDSITSMLENVLSSCIESALDSYIIVEAEALAIKHADTCASCTLL